MKAFRRAELCLGPPKAEILKLMAKFNLTRAVAKKQYNRLKADEIWLNDIYQVNLDRAPKHGFPFGLVHLSIKRIDRQSIHDWRQLQQIKNMLCSPEQEAIELYPAESRLADLANQYHLWVFEPGIFAPCGFWDRAVSGQSYGGAVQRPFDPGDAP